MTGERVPLHGDLRRAAVVLPTWVGDTVMATPVLQAVRQALPEAKLTAITSPGQDELLAGLASLDEVIAMNAKGLTGPLRAGRTLRRLKAEAVLLLPNSFRSALAARLGGVPLRIGYRRDGRGSLLTHGLEVAKSDCPIPAVEYYIALGRYATGLDEIPATLELAVTDEQDAAAAKLLAGIDGPFILLNPGASKSEKRWPIQRFARVAEALARSTGLAVAATGSPAERNLISELAGGSEAPIVNLAERGITLGSLKAVVRRASLLITNDTGPRHIAAAVGTPSVCLFGPTDHRWTTLPDANERVLLAEPFLPEELVADRMARACGIDRIRVPDVISAAESLLDAGCGEGA